MGPNTPFSLFTFHEASNKQKLIYLSATSVACIRTLELVIRNLALSVQPLSAQPLLSSSSEYNLWFLGRYNFIPALPQHVHFAFYENLIYFNLRSKHSYGYLIETEYTLPLWRQHEVRLVKPFSVMERRRVRFHLGIYIITITTV